MRFPSLARPGVILQVSQAASKLIKALRPDVL
jgi:hypothetical protein